MKSPGINARAFKPKVMEKLLKDLTERVTDYGTSGLELLKLKALDKSSDIVSSYLSSSVVYCVIASFFLFLNLGLALWLGEILGKVYFGFLVVAAFYSIVGLVVHFLMRKWLKKRIRNYIIKQVLK